MTTETRTTIELGDIVAIEFECNKCHTRTMRLLNNWLKHPISCTNCGESWMLSHSGDFSNLEMFTAFIRNFPVDKPFKLRLELKNDGTEKTKA